MAGPNDSLASFAPPERLTVAALPDPSAIPRRTARRAGQAPQRPVGLRAKLERFPDVETNRLRGLGRPRRSACARAGRGRTGRGADHVRGSRRPDAERCPAASCRRACGAASDRRTAFGSTRDSGGPTACPAPTWRSTRDNTSSTAAPAPIGGRRPTACSAVGGRAPAAGHSGRRRAATPAAGRSRASRGAPAVVRARQG